ncbi:hypothetical protein D3C76_1855560 [compost metagenome]
MLIKTTPTTKNQKLREFRNGKATSRAPICNGTTTFIRPTTKGIAMKKIMMTPWAVKIWS